MTDLEIPPCPICGKRGVLTVIEPGHYAYIRCEDEVNCRADCEVSPNIWAAIDAWKGLAA